MVFPHWNRCFNPSSPASSARTSVTVGHRASAPSNRRALRSPPIPGAIVSGSSSRCGACEPAGCRLSAVICLWHGCITWVMLYLNNYYNQATSYINKMDSGKNPCKFCSVIMFCFDMFCWLVPQIVEFVGKLWGKRFIWNHMFSNHFLDSGFCLVKGNISWM